MFTQCHDNVIYTINLGSLFLLFIDAFLWIQILSFLCYGTFKLKRKIIQIFSYTCHVNLDLWIRNLSFCPLHFTIISNLLDYEVLLINFLFYRHTHARTRRWCANIHDWTGELFFFFFFFLFFFSFLGCMGSLLWLLLMEYKYLFECFFCHGSFNQKGHILYRMI